MAATKRVVPVQVLVRDDANYCRMMSQAVSPVSYSSAGNPIDPSLFSKLSLTDIYRQQVMEQVFLGLKMFFLRKVTLENE